MRPEVVRRIVDAGRDRQSTMEEAASIRLAPEELERQLRETDELLSTYADPRWFRPGSGMVRQRDARSGKQGGYEVVLASMWPVDAWLPWPPFVARYVGMQAVRARSSSSTTVRRGERTADILRRVLPELRRAVVTR
jgi:hypothetical protein